MINKSNIQNQGVLQSLRESMTNDIDYQNWKIKKHSSGDYLFLEEINNCLWFSDKTDFIERFFDKIYNRNFNSILCGGLGLGVVPYLVQSFCDKIDVVELSQTNIDLIKNNTTYLDSKVNIINADIFTYQTNEKYDVILIDTWTCNLQNFETEKNNLTLKYMPNLNQDGLLYIPLDGWYPSTNNL
jgi:spermidine synthase